MSNSSYISSSSQIARYRPELSDNNKTISCTVKQEENGRTHFTRTFVFRLEINSRDLAASSSGLLGKHINFLLGLLVGVIFIILTCVLIALAALRQRKRGRGAHQQTSLDLDYMIDSELSTPLMIKRETLSRDCENGETPRWASQKYNESSFSSPPHPPSNIEKFLADYASTPSSDRGTYNYLPVRGGGGTTSLTHHSKNFTSPSSIRSLSASQLSSMESFTDLTAPGTTVHEETFNHVEEIICTTKIDYYNDREEDEITCKSDPLTRCLINPHQRRSSGIALTFPSEPLPPPPRPPRSSKSLGHIPKSLESETQRKRRRTAPSASKSTHSLFECSEGCFDLDVKKSYPQLVTITTGPMVI